MLFVRVYRGTIREGTLGKGDKELERKKVVEEKQRHAVTVPPYKSFVY